MSALCGVYPRITTIKYGGGCSLGVAAAEWGVQRGCKEGRGREERRDRAMFAIAAFAVIGRSYCLVLDDYAKLLFTPFALPPPPPPHSSICRRLCEPIVANVLHCCFGYIPEEGPGYIN